MTDENICLEVFTTLPLHDYIPIIRGEVGVAALLLAALYLLSAAVTLFWARQQRTNALAGMEGAALHVIFPFYLPVMWASAISDVILAVALLLIDVRLRETNSWKLAGLGGLIVSIQHFIIEGIGFMLLQYGCGKQAVRQASFSAVLWAATTFVCAFLGLRAGIGAGSGAGVGAGGGDSEAAYNIALSLSITWEVMLVCLYAVLWLIPETSFFRRPAMIYYARGWALLRAFALFCEIVGRTEDSTAVMLSNCALSFFFWPVYAVFKPIHLYRTLLLDSQWWQGVLPAYSPWDYQEEDESRDSWWDWFRLSNRDKDEESKILSRPVYSTLEGHGGAVLHPMGDKVRNDSWWTRLKSWRSASGSQHDYMAVSTTMSGNSYGPQLASNDLFNDNDKMSVPSDRGDWAVDGEVSSVSSASYGQDVMYSSIHGPLAGIEVGFDRAQALAREADVLDGWGTVQLLNCAYLSLDKSRLLGAGSFTKVYPGRYRGASVAIKMLFTHDLEPVLVRRASQEARLLSELGRKPAKHNAHQRNIVHIFGLAILPPSVCVVLEHCEYGSLNDVLRGSSRVNSSGSSSREAVSLSLSDRMFLALGCARGLAALHAYSPTLCHRDIKSFNFLIDSQFNAKLADLDLGELRNSLCQSSEDNSPFAGSNMMISWQAPEVLRGDMYVQSADIYSLAVVLWEIIAAGRMTTKFVTKNGTLQSRPTLMNSLPYEECATQAEVREKLLSGKKPPLEFFLPGSKLIPDRHGTVDLVYVEMIQQAWSSEPTSRPSADQMTDVIYECWLQCMHRHIRETPHVINAQAVEEEVLTSQMLAQLSCSGLSSQNISPGTSISLSSFGSRSRAISNATAPSVHSMSLLGKMKAEPAWARLEDAGIFVVLTPTPAALVLWATKALYQLLGCRQNDVLTKRFDTLLGPQSRVDLLDASLASARNGIPEHLVVTTHRLDGRTQKISIHLFPILVSRRSSTASDASGLSPQNIAYVVAQFCPLS